MKTIGETAFTECPFNSIEIPASVETIEVGAFNNCIALQTVTFEKGTQLKTIGEVHDYHDIHGAFYGCTSLTTIEIPASVETIKYSAFNGCTSLKTVTFEKGSKLKMIEGSLFSDCTSLTSIEIPASVETIREDAFARCTSLQTVTFEKGSKLKTVDGFNECTSLITIEIPASVETIEYGAFAGCTSLTMIEIPASVETIREDAFARCTSLQTVTFEKGSKLKTVDGFNECTSLITIEIPASVEEIRGYAFKGCTSLKTVTFEKGSKLKTISNGAFAFCWALTTVDMSACTQVTVIGEYAFYEDSKLQLFKIGTRTPPSCGDDVFSRYINSSSVLKVPAGCVDAYKKATGWNKFTTISELDE